MSGLIIHWVLVTFRFKPRGTNDTWNKNLDAKMHWVRPWLQSAIMARDCTVAVKHTCSVHSHSSTAAVSTATFIRPRRDRLFIIKYLNGAHWKATYKSKLKIKAHRRGAFVIVYVQTGGFSACRINTNPAPQLCWSTLSEKRKQSHLHAPRE